MLELWKDKKNKSNVFAKKRYFFIDINDCNRYGEKYSSQRVSYLLISGVVSLLRESETVFLLILLYSQREEDNFHPISKIVSWVDSMRILQVFRLLMLCCVT
jgi:hypothetical protein